MCVNVLDRIPRLKIGHRAAAFESRVAILFVVQVDEACKKYCATRIRSAVKGDSRVVEKSVCAGSNCWIGRSLKTMDRRRQSLQGGIERVAREKCALPGPAAVKGFEQTQPRVAAFFNAEQSWEVYGPIIVRAGKQMRDVPCGHGN